MMTWTKAKIAAAIVAVAAVGTVGTVSISTTWAADPAGAARSGPGGLAAAAQAEHKKADDNGVTLATAPPVVVKTVPQSGAAEVDAAATTEIRVTFSKEMQDGSWSWTTWGENTFPTITGKPRYEADKRTCILPVKLEPGRTYATWLNSQNFGNFKDASGQKAVPYLLIFETKK